ncbi:hypothetical protein MJH12_13065 [bacterium]|nr:hypothetical protein [bacterium]
MVIIGIATMLFHKARQNVNVFQFYTGKEKNYYLAQAGQTYSKSLIDQALLELNTKHSEVNDDPIIENLKEWILSQFKETGNKEEYNIDIEPLESFLSEDENLNIQVIISDWKPIIIRSPYGLSTNDNTEFQATLKIRSKASIQTKKVKKTIETVSYTRLKRVNIIPSILSKFVLYLKSKNGDDFNSIQDSSSFRKVSHTPIMIYSGQETTSQKSSPTLIAEKIERAGWIYLGQNDWEINASQMANQKSYQSPFLSEINFKQIPEETPLSLPGAKYISMKKGFDNEAHLALTNQNGRLPYNIFSLEDRFDLSYSSDFNLFGSRDNPNVTFVFGSVIRNYLQLRGVFISGAGKVLYLPYLNEDDFHEEQWPVSHTPPESHYFSNTFKNQLTQEGSPDLYASYKDIMSKVITEPINRSILAGLHINKEFPFKYQTSSIPNLSNLISKKQHLAYYKEANDNSSYTILNERGETLVNNIKIQDIDINYLKAKVSKRFKSASEFFSQSKVLGNEINVSGVLVIKGDLDINREIKIEKYNGGIILVTGNIRIRNNIDCKDNELLTLISLNGNIRIDNNLDIKAGLIAMNGSIKLPKQFSIYGLIAANDVDLTKPLNRVSNRSIRYNLNYDPSNSHNYNNQYRISYEQEWSHYVQ